MKPNEMFASRDTLEEAHEYCMDVVRALPKDTQFVVTTAINVLINTALKTQGPSPKDITPNWSSATKIHLAQIKTDAQALQAIRNDLAPFALVVTELTRQKSETADMVQHLFVALSLLFGLEAEDLAEEVIAFEKHMVEEICSQPDGLLELIRARTNKS